MAITKGTWTVEKGRDKTHPYNIVGEDFDLARVVEKDDADLIVRAVENHEELLKALKYARRFLRKEDHDTDYIDAVIAKATI